MLKATFHQVQSAEHTCRKWSTLHWLTLRICSIFQPMEQALPFGRLTCVLSALPTSPWSNRPRNRPHPTALGDCIVVGVFSCFVSILLLSLAKQTSSEIATITLFSLTEGRPPGQRPSLSHAAFRQKKLPSQAKLPLHDGSCPTWQMCQWPWNVKSTISLSQIILNTNLDHLGKTGRYLQLHTFFALHCMISI